MIPTKQDVKELQDELLRAFEGVLFDPIRELSGFVENSIDAVRRALYEGKIEYVDGVLRGQFGVNLARYMEKENQVWDNKKRGYIINKPELLALIGSATARFTTTQQQIARFLGAMGDVQLGIDKKVVDGSIDSVIKGAGKHIGIETPVDAKQQKAEMFDSLNVSGVAFIVGTAVKLIQDLNEAKSFKDLRNLIDIRYGQAKRKSAVLADESSFYFGAQARQMFYKDQGITHFKWVTRKDAKVRASHKALDGDTFSYNDPPIVDGKPLMPGGDYGCRCVDFPIKPKPKDII